MSDHEDHENAPVGRHPIRQTPWVFQELPGPFPLGSGKLQAQVIWSESMRKLWCVWQRGLVVMGPIHFDRSTKKSKAPLTTTSLGSSMQLELRGLSQTPRILFCMRTSSPWTWRMRRGYRRWRWAVFAMCNLHIPPTIVVHMYSVYNLTIVCVLH